MKVNVDEMIKKYIEPLPDAEERLKSLINDGKNLTVLAIEYDTTDSGKAYVRYFVQYWTDWCAYWVDANLCDITDLYTPDDWVVSGSYIYHETLKPQCGFIVGPKSWNATFELRSDMYNNLDTRPRTSKEWKLFKKTLEEYERLGADNIENCKKAREDFYK